MLRDFMITRRSEVVKVTKLDYTFDRQILLEREDAREEGRAEGRAEERVESMTESIRNLMDSLNMSMEQAMDALKIPEDERKTYINKL